MTFVETFEPRALWAHFDRLLSIPRGSKEEEQAREYVIEVAERAGLPYQVDNAGNVVVRKPASAGKEGAPIVVLQSHLDMVNEKDSDIQHDFATDPIRPREEGGWLYATGTTLGADNGIGVASMLAILEAKDLVHGPLELLFTIDEETGLTGAARLDGGMLQGRILLNLDTEEEGSVTVGCAGAGDTNLTLPLHFEPAPAGGTALAVRLRGLKGGHSGMEIHLQRGNAVKLLARLLHAAAHGAPGHLAAFEGGNKRNAIPREASATLAVYAADAAGCRERLQREFEAVKAELAASDPGVELQVEDAPLPAQVWTAESTRTALHLLQALPHGVLAMSLDIPGLVETSSNVAMARVRDGALHVGCSTRSSVGSALRAARMRLHAIGALAGAEIAQNEGYPGWKPNLASPLLGIFQEVHREVAGKEAQVEAVHAGLEAGIIGEKVPGMDMISFGPQIESPHSPTERVRIDSVDRFHRLLTATLQRLAA